MKSSSGPGTWQKAAEGLDFALRFMNYGKFWQEIEPAKALNWTTSRRSNGEE